MSKGNGHKTETPDVSHIRNEEVSHETSDINVMAVLSFVLILSVSTVAVYVGMSLLFNYFQAQGKAAGERRGPMALKDNERLPPEPRLQAAPGFEVNLENGEKVDLKLKEPQAEYNVLAAQWDKALKGELKDQTGVTTMPIDKAIEEITKQGLPTRATGGAAKLSDFAIRIPSASSSGRMTEKIVSSPGH
jgi:hypothetical protein